MARRAPRGALLGVVITWLVPRWVTPNMFTMLRCLLVPVVIFVLLLGNVIAGFVLFVLAVLTDALDGALARRRHKVTPWGTLHDPIADKLLITSVAVVAVSVYADVYLAAAIVLGEVFIVFAAYLRNQGEIVPARLVGKIKMVFQSVGTAVLLLGVAVLEPVLVDTGIYVLYAAVGLAGLSLFVYRSV